MSIVTEQTDYHGIFNGIDYVEYSEEPACATKWQLIWLCGLILSFCYEIPLIQLTPYYRANPHFYDFVILIGIFTVLPFLKNKRPIPRIFKPWFGLVFVFIFCAIVWVPMLPLKYSRFSLFYAIKYLVQLLTFYIVLNIPLDARQKRIIHYMIVAGGIFVGTYAIPEYLRGGTTRVLIEGTDKEEVAREGYLMGSLSTSYFHISMFSALSLAMTLALAQGTRNILVKLFLFAIGVLVGWPAFFSGSRTGVIAGGVVLIFAIYFSVNKIKPLLFCLIFIVMFALLLDVHKLIFFRLAEISSSFEKFIKTEQMAHQGLKSRLSLDWYQLSAYKWQGWRVPFIGAGFYVAPHTYPDGTLYYRIGYGFHNSYIFAFEQGGILAFVFFIMFVIRCGLGLKRSCNSLSRVDSIFARGAFAYFVSMCVLGLVNLPFWICSSLENFNTYWLLVFLIALRPTEISSQYEIAEFRDESSEDISLQ